MSDRFFQPVRVMVPISLVLILTMGITIPVWSEPSPSESPTHPGLALAESERKRLGEIEHYGLILTQKAFPGLASRILESDTVGLKQVFSPSFRGESLEPESSRNLMDLIHVRRSLTDPSRVVQPKTAEGFAHYLTELRKGFQSNPTNPKIGFALRGLAPTKKNQYNGSWKGSCLLRFAGRSTDGGPKETRLELAFRLSRIPEVEKIDEATGWIAELRVLDFRDVAAASPLMEEVAKERGIDPVKFYDNWMADLTNRPVNTGGAYVADFDNDLRLDILITDLNGLFFYRNQPDGNFAEVATPAGLPRSLPPYPTVALGDFDNDNHVDLVLGPIVLRNRGEFQFEDISRKTNLEMPELATGCTVGDYDLDGRLDIYVSRSSGSVQNTSWIDGPGGPGNQLWRNLGDWRFEEVAEKVNATAGNRSVFTAAWLDVNDDGRPDIYAIGEFGPGVLLVNQPDGTFMEMPLEPDDGDFGTMGLAVGDYNNDGHVDVYTANMYSKAGRRVIDNLSPATYPPEILARIKRFITGSELYRNDGNLGFHRVGEAMALKDVGWTYGSTFVDLDNDGYLDLYSNAGFSSVTRAKPDG